MRYHALYTFSAAHFGTLLLFDLQLQNLAACGRESHKSTVA